jgi:predicted enzyme related to lactoylglutathione lyase
MAHIAHFAINADDLPRARAFYEGVFGWKFQAWGPPGFFQIDMGSSLPAAPVMGALQQRRPLVEGAPLRAFECTISVADIAATAQAIPACGGRIVMQPVTLPGVGRLLFFEDPEGNVAGAMQYDSNAA